MSKTVEKWVAGFWCDRLYVAKGDFKETKKQLRRESGSHHDDVDTAIHFGHTFPRDTDLLHDTRTEALDALYGRESQKRIDLLKKVEAIDIRMDLLNNFEEETP